VGLNCHWQGLFAFCRTTGSLPPTRLRVTPNGAERASWDKKNRLPQLLAEDEERETLTVLPHHSYIIGQILNQSNRTSVLLRQDVLEGFCMLVFAPRAYRREIEIHNVTWILCQPICSWP
jgi:hypothetical protein